jgi:hypothetical protein
MGNNSAYTDMEAAVIGLSNSLKDNLTKDILTAVCYIFSRYPDIDSGGSWNLTDWNGRDMERIVIETCRPDFNFELVPTPENTPNYDEEYFSDEQNVEDWRWWRESDEFDAIMRQWRDELKGHGS